MLRELSLLLLLLVVICTQSVLSVKRSADDENTQVLNATACYEPVSEQCCNGIVQPKNRLEKCCGAGVYNLARQKCCGGVVYNIAVGFLCCGNVTYDTEKEICCNGHVIISADAKNPKLGCCGKNTYDNTKQKCCQVNSNTTAIINTTNLNSICCGDKLYDQKTEFCCEDEEANKYEVYSKEENNGCVGCCGSQKMDPNTQSCCGDKAPYNNNDEICSYMSGVEGYVVVQDSKPGDQCCPYARKSYDPETHVCCVDEVIEKGNKNLACCGNNTYDMDEEVCCWSVDPVRSIKKESPEHDACCRNKSYCLNTHTCCEHNNKSTIHCNDENKSYGCCGLDVYEYANKICCGTEISTQTEEFDLQCCGDKTINSNKQTCCCNYDFVTYQYNCTVVDDYKPNSFCCGSEIYTQGTNKDCCNNKIYDKESEVCCVDQIIDKKGKNSRDTCCYPYSPDDDENTC